MLRFLALGDSYTIGERVEPSARWTSTVVRQLAILGVELAEPEIIATTGWTTGELEAGIHVRDPKGPFALVTLLIGVNNQYRGRSTAEYCEEFTRLLGLAIGFAGGDPSHVIVLSIPDWGVTPFAARDGRVASEVSAAVDEFNAINRRESERAGTHWIDVTPSSRAAVNDGSLLAPDGLHPSGSMYEVWANLVTPVALTILSPARS